MRKACAHDQAAARTEARAHYMSAELVRLGLGRVVSRHTVGVATWLGRIGVATWLAFMATRPTLGVAIRKLQRGPN